MYKLFLVFVLLTVWVPASFAETITVNTRDGPRTVKIKPNLLGWRQIRQSIQEDNYGDKWVVLESRYRRYNSEWGKWELRSEAPVPPYTTNMDLEATMKILTGKEKDIVALDVVFIHVRDKLGRSYWWENKLYCNFLHEMYELE